jgi:hypothetical protein
MKIKIDALIDILNKRKARGFETITISCNGKDTENKVWVFSNGKDKMTVNLKCK